MLEFSLEFLHKSKNCGEILLMRFSSIIYMICINLWTNILVLYMASLPTLATRSVVLALVSSFEACQCVQCV